MAEPLGRGLRAARRSGLTSPEPVSTPTAATATQAPARGGGAVELNVIIALLGSPDRAFSFRFIRGFAAELPTRIGLSAWGACMPINPSHP